MRPGKDEFGNMSSPGDNLNMCLSVQQVRPHGTSSMDVVDMRNARGTDMYPGKRAFW